MKAKTIPRSWMLSANLSLTSGPYLSGAFEARVALARLSARKELLQNVTKDGINGIFNGPRFARSYVNNPNYGIPFLGSTDILAADLSTLPYIAKTQVENYPGLMLDEGWTLITCSGTIGRTVYSRSDMKGLAGSQHFLRVIPDPDKIRPGYLYAYLSSKFGIPLIVSGTYGEIIQHIEPMHIADLPVPIAPDEVQQTIHDNIAQMARLRTKSAYGYRQATEMLFQAIGCIDPPRHEWLMDDTTKGFTTISATATTLRALNYDPRVRDLCTTLRERGATPLGSLCDPDHFKSGIIFKRIDAEQEFSVRLVGQRESFQVRPEGRWISQKSIKGLGLIVPSGTSLIAAHGTLGETELYGRTVYVTGRRSKYAYSGDFVRCIPLKEKIPSGYLFAFLSSETAFRILRSISNGSKLQAFYPELLYSIPVPRVSAEQEQQIHEIVEQSAADFDRSLELEEQAWCQIEQWIARESDG